MRRTLILLVVFCELFVTTSTVEAQLNALLSAPSPDVANLGLYGSIPVSHYTGIPNISIPIYDVKVGKYSLPISLNYHLASVKPNGMYGTLGLGWSLNAGGFITRTVNFRYDEKMGKNGKEYGYWGHTDKMKNVSSAADVFKQSVFEGCELSADEFTFNFCGYTGNFYLNENREWVVVSDDAIKVEFDENEDFATLDEISGRFKSLTQWTAKTYNNRFFKRFTLITPDGTKYIFGGVGAMEFSIPYYSRSQSDLIATTWKLSKIITTDGRTVDFVYNTKSMLCDLRYCPQSIESNLENGEQIAGGFIDDICNWLSGGDWGAPVEFYNYIKYIGYNGFSGFLIFPVNLCSIITENDTIVLNYQEDLSYSNRFVKKDLVYRNSSTSKMDFWGATNVNEYSPRNSYLAFMFIKRDFTINDIQNSILSNFKNYYLQSIDVTSRYGGNRKKIEFDMFDFNEGRPKLKELRIKGITNWGGESTMETKSWSFSYYSNKKMPFEFCFESTDSWGYYNSNQRLETSNSPSFLLQKPDLDCSRADVLSTITYPTGGWTSFYYELNRYSKVVTPNHSGTTYKSGYAGGLRISEITNYRSDNQIESTKKYLYTSDLEGKVWSGILREEPSFSVLYNMNDELFFAISSQGGFWQTAFNSDSPIVGYSSVVEKTMDSNRNILGYVRYTYSNYDKDIHGNSHFDILGDLNFLPKDTNIPFADNPCSSMSFERGKLLSKEYFGPDAKTLYKKTDYYYSPSCQGTMKLAGQKLFRIPVDNWITAYLGWFTNVYKDRYLPVSKVETIYDIKNGQSYTAKEEYTYNRNNLLYKKVENTSEGGSRVTNYKYPTDYDAYNWMCNRNILNPIISTSITEMGDTQTETAVYKYTPNHLAPYIESVKTKYGGGTDKTNYLVKKVDKFGNPLEIEVDGLKSALYWGFNGQVLAARVDNSNYEDFQVDYEDEESKNRYNIESWFYYLPKNVQAHGYYYRGLNLLEAEMQPTGVTTYYKYDGLDRLREIYHYDSTPSGVIKRVLKQYDYRYRKVE